jgi:hypothetical protein
MNYSSKTTETKTIKTTATTVTKTEIKTTERNISLSIQSVLDWFKQLLGTIFGI